MKLFDFLMRPRIKYDPLIKVMIFRDQLLENFRNYKKQYPHLDFAPVLKSNAYGHGLMEVASVLDPEQPAFFGFSFSLPSGAGRASARRIFCCQGSSSL